MASQSAVRKMEDEFFSWFGKPTLDAVCQLLGASGGWVYIWLCYHANIHDQTCYPSMKVLAKKARIGRDKVAREIRRLETAGFIEVKRKHGRPNVYRVLAYKPGSVDNLVKVICSSPYLRTGGRPYPGIRSGL